MKKRTIILTLLVSLLINSCFLGNATIPIANLKFEEEDFDKLIDLELYEKVIYTNESNEELSFEVVVVLNDYDKEDSKLGVTILYDRQLVKLISKDDIKLEYYFERAPLNEEDETNFEYIPSEFTGYIAILDTYTQIDYDTTTISMTIDDIIYEEVFVVNTLNEDIIYYVHKIGVIGFDNANGEKWRIRK